MLGERARSSAALAAAESSREALVDETLHGTSCSAGATAGAPLPSATVKVLECMRMYTKTRGDARLGAK